MMSNQQSFDFPAYRAARQQNAIDAAPPVRRNRQPPETIADLYYDVTVLQRWIARIARDPFGTDVHVSMAQIAREVCERLREMGEIDEDALVDEFCDL